MHTIFGPYGTTIHICLIHSPPLFHLSPFFPFFHRCQVCVDVGACDAEQFDFISEAQDYTQEQWDDKCFVCQAFAKDLEVCYVVCVWCRNIYVCSCISVCLCKCHCV